MSVLGQTCPDPVGLILGTGFQRFESPIGIEGLAKENGSSLDILAVVNPSDQRGRFRQFIARAQAEYSTICVWEIFNPAVEAALGRYGFAPEVELAATGEPLRGMRWDKPK